MWLATSHQKILGGFLETLLTVILVSDPSTIRISYAIKKKNFWAEFFWATCLSHPWKTALLLSYYLSSVWFIYLMLYVLGLGGHHYSWGGRGGVMILSWGSGRNCILQIFRELINAVFTGYLCQIVFKKVLLWYSNHVKRLILLYLSKRYKIHQHLIQNSSLNIEGEKIHNSPPSAHANNCWRFTMCSWSHGIQKIQQLNL